MPPKGHVWDEVEIEYSWHVELAPRALSLARHIVLPFIVVNNALQEQTAELSH